MMKIAFAAAAAAAMLTAAPLFVGAIPATAENLKTAQAGVEVQIGRDREEPARRDDRSRDRRNERSDVTVGIGPGGVVVGPRQRCRTVTTTIERDDGRKVKRTERRCD